MRVPRPDLSVTLATPNACNQCHDDKHASWAAARVKQWYGKSFNSYQQYAHALDAGRKGNAKAGEMLSELIRKTETPDVARASAVSALSPYIDQSNIDVLQKGLNDEDAMVRLASVSALEGLPQAMLVQLGFPLIDDPVRSVRIEAARVLAPIPVGQLQGDKLRKYNHAMDEYVDSQMVNAERPEAQLNLGNYYAAKGDTDNAIAAYKKAIKLEDVFAPAYINLADFYRVQKKEAEAEKVLRLAITIVPENADVNYALGLLLVRHHKNEQAIKFLQRAAGFNLSNARYSYVYGLALNSVGNKNLAIDVLQDANSRFPQDVNILEALVTFHRDAGNKFASQTYMKKLGKLNR
jgi:tetratricopeptide (TPR) repeat protein